MDCPQNRSNNNYRRSTLMQINGQNHLLNSLGSSKEPVTVYRIPRMAAYPVPCTSYGNLPCAVYLSWQPNLCRVSCTCHGNLHCTVYLSWPPTLYRVPCTYIGSLPCTVYRVPLILTYLIPCTTSTGSRALCPVRPLSPDRTLCCVALSLLLQVW